MRSHSDRSACEANIALSESVNRVCICLCLRPNDEQVLEMRRRGGGVMKREQRGGRSRQCVCVCVCGGGAGWHSKEEACSCSNH